jgi:hypothetical protein
MALPFLYLNDYITKHSSECETTGPFLGFNIFNMQIIGNVPILLIHDFISQKLLNRPMMVSYPCHHCWCLWSEYPVFSSTKGLRAYSR